MKGLHEAAALKERAPGDLTADWFEKAWKAAVIKKTPYKHWLINDVLPHEIARGIVSLPIAAPDIGDSLGRRDSHNSTRSFFSVENRRKYPVCEEVAAAFQNPRIVSLIEQATGTDFRGSYLRIEYCQDTDGFWLEPHTDIGAKLLTLSVFLSTAAGSENWGTDIYDNDRKHIGQAPAAFDQGYAFVPGDDTWHGVERRAYGDVRRSIIINYVKPEWRSRHELSYPETPIG